MQVYFKDKEGNIKVLDSVQENGLRQKIVSAIKNIGDAEGIIKIDHTLQTQIHQFKLKHEYPAEKMNSLQKVMSTRSRGYQAIGR